MVKEEAMVYVPSEEDARKASEELKRMEKEHAEAIATANVPTEAELRDATVPTPQTQEELDAYIRSLVDRPHDYGTCVYAMSMAAVATYNYVAHKLGVTGFQAGAADMDILRRTRHLERGRILDYNNLLYPQYCDEEHFPSWQVLIQKNKDWLREEAKKRLAENGIASDGVTRHWKTLAAL